MNGTIMEVLVRRKPSTGLKILSIVLKILAVLIFFSFFITRIVGILVGIGLYLVAWYVGLLSQAEYEYSYFDKELDVDVIYSMTKRKHIATYDLGRMEVLAPANSYHLDSYKNRQVNTKDYSSGYPEDAQNAYVMYLGGERLIFEPTPAMIKAIANIAPRKVFTE